MSKHSFDRRFCLPLGVSHKSWLNQQRVALAKRIMESEHLSLEHLASKAGFDNSITLRSNVNKYDGDCAKSLAEPMPP
jgi:AraC family transcriptional activator FtrA